MVDESTEDESKALPNAQAKALSRSKARSTRVTRRESAKPRRAEGSGVLTWLPVRPCLHRPREQPLAAAFG